MNEELEKNKKDAEKAQEELNKQAADLRRMVLGTALKKAFTKNRL
jgi:peptidoglycan hydrolase CwlO-like protein